jgi:hypothetical protein
LISIVMRLGGNRDHVDGRAIEIELTHVNWCQRQRGLA